MNKNTNNYFTVSIDPEFHRALAGEVQFRASHNRIFYEYANCTDWSYSGIFLRAYNTL